MGTWNRRLLLGCISPTMSLWNSKTITLQDTYQLNYTFTYQASCIREFYRRRLTQGCMAVGLERRIHIWCNWLSIHRSPHKFQTDIHSRVLRLRLLGKKKFEHCATKRWIAFLTIKFTLSTLDRPIVVAVIVNSAFSIEQQSVFACLQRQCTIGAQEELIAMFWMSISLNAFWFGAVCWSPIC